MEVLERGFWPVTKWHLVGNGLPMREATMKKLDARGIVRPEVTEVGKIWFGNKTVLPTASQEMDARIGMIEKRLAALEGDLAVINEMFRIEWYKQVK